MPTMDIFNDDAFSVVSLTEAINDLSFKPGRLGQMGIFAEKRISTTTAMIERQGELLRIVGPTPRGGPGNTLPKQGRSLIPLRVPHYEIEDAVNADEVQNVRAFGTESEMETVLSRVTERQSLHVDSFALTEEHARMGAIKGEILYEKASDGVLYEGPLNLYTAMGMTRPADITWNFASTAADGEHLAGSTAVIRAIGTTLGGIAMGRIHAFVGDEFYDALIGSKEVRETYKGTSQAEWLRGQKVTHGLDGASWGVFEYGGIIWENYRGGEVMSAAGEVVSFIGPREARFFPVGVPGLFQSIYAPADYIETVNTVARRLYTKSWPSANGKRQELESQMNALQICTRPNALRRAVMA